MTASSRQSGFTLVEILVALTIGLFLAAGMLQMYVANKHTFRFSDALARIQENGRYAVAFIARDMRMADFWGCSRGDVRFPQNLNASGLNPGLCTTPDASSTNALFGTDGADGAPDAPDSIILRGSVGTGLLVDSITDDNLYVEGTLAAAKKVIDTGDIALVSNCRGGVLFQVTGVSDGSPTLLRNDPGGSSPGNKDSILFNTYKQTATVHTWREVIYSIDAGPNGENGLFVQENACAGGARRELVEGVENMQIAYGEDVDADPDHSADRYVRATDVTDWNDVVSVRVSLLLASPSGDESLVDQTQRIRFDDFDSTDDDTFTAADRRVYQVLTTTFALRNRTP